MKRLSAIVALALALTGTAAFAEQDSHSSGWSGFNVGLDSGYAWDPSICTSASPVTNNIPTVLSALSLGDLIFLPGVLTPNEASALSASGCVHPNVGGFIGGGQIGYNYQAGDSIVAGIEADFQGATAQGRQGFLGTASSILYDSRAGHCGTAHVGCPDPVMSFVDDEKSIHWLGTVRPRLGFLPVPTLLVYATGGLAYGGVAAGTSISQTWAPRELPPIAPPTTYQSPGADGHFSGARVGWTIGGGLEWLFLPNWSVKVEYLHYDLGSVRFASGPLLTILPVNLVSTLVGHTIFDTAVATTSTRFYGDTVRVGVNYHFTLN